MMAEDGIGDFGFAKRKAAKQLGARDTEALPNNTEIQEALRAWQSLYQDEEQTQRVAAMRRAALGIMRLLQDFRPYLTGGALDGTAGRYAFLEIDAFPECSKDVEIFFLNQGVPYEYREPRKTFANPPDSVLMFDWEDVPVRLSLYPPTAERGALHGQERARLEQVENLLGESPEGGVL